MKRILLFLEEQTLYSYFDCIMFYKNCFHNCYGYYESLFSLNSAPWNLSSQNKDCIQRCIDFGTVKNSLLLLQSFNAMEFDNE